MSTRVTRWEEKKQRPQVLGNLGQQRPMRYVERGTVQGIGRGAQNAIRTRGADFGRESGKWNVYVFPVNFGGGREEHQFAFLCGRFQHKLRAIHIGLNRAHGAFDNQAHANGGSQMKNHVGFIHQLRQKLAILDWFEKIVHAVVFLEARIFSMLPVERLSISRTSSPSASNRSARWEPMKPAPPVIRARTNLPRETEIVECAQASRFEAPLPFLDFAGSSEP